jgi:TATA-binding protein-associated factor
MSYIQTELYQDFAQSEASKGLSDLLDDEDQEVDNQQEKKKSQGPQHVFQALHYLKKVVNHPLLVLKKDHPKWSQIQSHLHSMKSSLHDYRHSGINQYSTGMSTLLFCQIKLKLVFVKVRTDLVIF